METVKSLIRKRGYEKSRITKALNRLSDENEEGVDPSTVVGLCEGYLETVGRFDNQIIDIYYTLQQIEDLDREMDVEVCSQTKYLVETRSKLAAVLTTRQSSPASEFGWPADNVRSYVVRSCVP